MGSEMCIRDSLYQKASLQRRLNIALAPGSELLLVEPIVFGRTAMGEVITEFDFQDRIEINRDGTPLFRDSIHLQGDLTRHMSEKGAGAAAMASIILVAPNAITKLERIRAHLSDHSAANAIHDDLVYVCLLYTSPSPRDLSTSRMPSSA